uniref:C-type lectin domain-containing protein n=1 Tax=Spermophilus dauricus TaxID=99837 RepID=A0A8C9P5V4_SPEDA
MGDFNTPLSPLDRSSKQKLNKETIELNNTINNLDLTDIYRIYQPSSSVYTFFSAAHGSFSKIDHILCHRATLSKYKGVEIIPCTLSDHSGMKLEINDKRRKGKPYITWKMNNMLLNDQCVTEDIKEEIKKFLEINENTDTTYRNLWDTMKLQCPKRWLQLQDKCFTISSSSKTWNDSLADCSQGESSLLLIQDQEELRFIQNLIKNEGIMYWIGLNFTLSEKKWKWINGSLLNHDILKIFGENKENSCAAISKMTVFSESCNSENKWICEKKLKPYNLSYENYMGKNYLGKYLK